MPTCFEIYETYRRGPAAVLRLFEETLGTLAIYGPPDPDMQQRTIDALSDEIGRLKRQVSRLKRELGEARGEADRLRRRNAELEKLVTKDSHNSSRPPSTDPPWATRTKSLTRALETGLTYRQVQMMSKHRDPKTVMRYDHGRENLELNAVNLLQYEEADISG